MYIYIYTRACELQADGAVAGALALPGRRGAVHGEGGLEELDYYHYQYYYHYYYHYGHDLVVL